IGRATAPLRLSFVLRTTQMARGIRQPRVTGMARRIRHPRRSDRPRPWIGMRLWLGFAFALVGAITAVTVYRFVHDSNEKVISERSTELAVGRTIHLADQLGMAKNAAEVVRAAKDTGFNAWYFGTKGRLNLPQPAGPTLDSIDVRRKAVAEALSGRRFTSREPSGVTVVAAPVFRHNILAGAVLGRY